MKVLTLKIVLICCVFAFSACNKASSNSSDSVFEKYSPMSREYKNELAAKVKSNPDELRYTFTKLVENDGNDYLDIEIKGHDFNATGLVLVNSWNKLEGIKRTEGKSYTGAELRGLKLDVQENSSGANLIYRDLEKIVD